jgi:hypothetical protein
VSFPKIISARDAMDVSLRCLEFANKISGVAGHPDAFALPELNSVSGAEGEARADLIQDNFIRLSL